MGGKHSTKNPVEPVFDTDDRMPGDLDDIVSVLDEPDDAADELSGEAELAPPELEAEDLAGDNDYPAVEEAVAEDPRDL